LVASDTVTRRNLACYVGSGENEDEILKFLLILKSKLRREPDLITVDFSPSWDDPIKQVFPHGKIQRCAFHSVQLLNRAILKDLTGFGRERFASRIKDLKHFSRCLRKETSVEKLQKMTWTCELVTKSLSHYAILLNLKRIKDVGEFEKSFFEFLSRLDEGADLLDLFLAEELTRRLPPNNLTVKSLKYFKKEVFRAQRKVLRKFREQIEVEKARFSECRFLLLTRPERLWEGNREILERFLTDYPEFQAHGDLSLQVSGIFRTRSRSDAKNRIKNLETRANAHPDLHAAIKTLKKHEPELVRFHDFVTSKEDWLHLKGIRCVISC